MQRACSVSRTAARPAAKAAARPARNVARMGMAGQNPGQRPLEWLPGEWPDPELIAETDRAFPDDGIANIEQSRCLFSDLGYEILDIRCEPEIEMKGTIGGRQLVAAGVKSAIQVPLIEARHVFDASVGDKVFQQTINPYFVDDVRAAGLNESSKIIIMCSDGRKRSIMALMALDDAGFKNIVGMKGGYNTWERIFDKKMGRRLQMNAKEVFGHDGDSCGIHGTGAGFAKVDSVMFDLGPIGDKTEWVDWQEEMAKSGAPAPSPAPAAGGYDSGYSAPPPADNISAQSGGQADYSW